MEDKGSRKTIRGYNSDNISNAKKIADAYIKLIHYQEDLFNVTFKKGKWVRRRNVTR